MACLGAHFALTEDEAKSLRGISSEEARLSHLQEVIEDVYFKQHPQFKAESDKAWDAMHRVLSDGQLTWKGGKYPLNHVVLVGEQLYTKPDYIMSLKTPKQVVDISTALSSITQDEFKRRYFDINKKSGLNIFNISLKKDSSDYSHPLSEEDFSYTWDCDLAPNICASGCVV